MRIPPTADEDFWSIDFTNQWIGPSHHEGFHQPKIDLWPWTHGEPSINAWRCPKRCRFENHRLTSHFFKGIHWWVRPRRRGVHNWFISAWYVWTFGETKTSKTSKTPCHWEDIVIFEKNLFLSYSEWSPELKDLLRSNAKIMAFQRRAYALYKERFAPGATGWAKTLQIRCGFQVLTYGSIRSHVSHVQSCRYSYDSMNWWGSQRTQTNRALTLFRWTLNPLSDHIELLGLPWVMWRAGMISQIHMYWILPHFLDIF